MDTLDVLHRLPHHLWFDQKIAWVQRPDCYPQFTLAAALARPASILEIGAFEGLGLVSFILGHEPDVVSWVDDESYEPGLNQRCQENLEWLRTQGYTRFAVRDVTTSLAGRPRAHYDLVHIDGDHSFEGCLSDLVWAYFTCSPYVILVDDATNMGEWPGVKRACDYFAARFSLPYRIWQTYHGWAVFNEEK